MPNDVIPAIETTYRGVTFRSRLEAKWAAFFDLLGWPWQYEPLDLKGYIPDFILTLPHAPVLVEVKPALYLRDLFQYEEKIERSGWDKESLLVGTQPLIASIWNGAATLGLLDERGPEGSHWWAEAMLEKCSHCKKISFYHGEARYHCRLNGCYDGDSYLGPVRIDWALNLFSEAARQVRWKP